MIQMIIFPDQQVIQAFFRNDEQYKMERFGNGHIHHTFLVKNENNDRKYILQALNESVFPDTDLLIQNHLFLQKHLPDRTQGLIGIPRLIPTAEKKSSYLFSDSGGITWRLMEFIPDTYSVDQMENTAMAGEAGKAYGWFMAATKDLDASRIQLSIPKFHDLRHRLRELDQAVAEDRAKRKKTCEKEMHFFENRRSRLLAFSDKVSAGHIPLRITHNDTKINNVLFRGKQAVAVIDLDTVGPGIIHYDYGDSLRTIANTAVEDEQNLEKVAFNRSVFESFTRAYLGQCALLLTPPEKSSLYLAPGLMTYIIGIRFLADYLNGDSYFHTQYPLHNLVRTKVQQKLLMSMEKQENTMKAFIEQTFDKFN